MKKRILAFVLSCLLAFTVLPVAASVEPESPDPQPAGGDESTCAHVWELESVLSESDCKNGVRGIGRYRCSECGATDYRQLPLHSYDAGVMTQAPTCTENGVITFTCAGCGATYTENILAAGHSYDAGTVTTAPTCTQNGVRTVSCTECGAFYTEAIPATGHSYGAGVKTEPTCTENGYTTYTCTGCGDSYRTDIVPATGHSYDAGVVTTDPTCSDPGVKTFTCTGCGATYTQTLPATGHSYSQVTVTPPSCTADGYTTHTCACGAYYVTDVTPALGHNYDSGAVTTEPTCTEKGVRTFTCTNQGCAECYTQEIPASGHSYGNGVVTAPTCTEDGYTTYTCTSCGTSYKTDVVPATGHSYDAGVTVTAPTCMDEGVLRYTCTVCGYEHDESLPATAEHQWSGQEYVTSDGLCVYTLCTVCDEVLVLKNFGSGEVTPGTDFSRTIEADVTLSATLEDRIVLSVAVEVTDARLEDFGSLWLDINGLEYPLAASDFANGSYTGSYRIPMVLIGTPISVTLRGTYAGVACAAEPAAYSFAQLEGDYTEDAIDTTMLPGATARFTGRGVQIGETVTLLYQLEAAGVSASDVLVLRYYDNGEAGEVYAEVPVGDMALSEDGLFYTAQITVSADAWSQVFAATICDAEGTALSNTNYYSVSLYASRYITDDMEDSLSRVLRAMLQAIAA